jgi:hypothetical protein
MWEAYLTGKMLITKLKKIDIFYKKSEKFENSGVRNLNSRIPIDIRHTICEIRVMVAVSWRFFQKELDFWGIV